MSSIISTLHFLTITISIILLTCTSANEVNDRHTTCASTLLSCGKNTSNVGYPFWGDARPQYCGHPSFQLLCINSPAVGDFPILKLGREDNTPFNVINMKTSQSSITLELQWFLNVPRIIENEDFSKSFKYTPIVETIKLLHSCPVEIQSDKIQETIMLTLNMSYYNTYYMHENMDVSKEYESCKITEVPVLRQQLDLYKKGKIGNLTEALKQGFEVKYVNGEECRKCVNSGGICGSSQELNFACLCKNGPATHVCPSQNTGSWKLILGIGITGGLLILLGLSYCLWRYLKPKLQLPVVLSRTRSGVETETDTFSKGVPVFHYSELQEATNNFDEAKKLGDGGFGIVYYGKLRDGREVAVKRLYEKNYKQAGQFMNEVEILTRLRHPNLVTLYGCTSQHSQEHLLVYEYIYNGTVADHLHGDRSGLGALTWEIRMKIAVETASALSYLHSSEIVHRDVKTDNILLNDNFSVKVADFGLSRLFPVNVTHVSTAPQGTPGYLDPEYYKCYQVTSKSDVYSFGVVLVELISSLPAVDLDRQEDEYNLSDYALNRIKRGAINELADHKLGYNSNFKLKRMISLVAEMAFRCLQQEKDARPSMTEVLKDLVRIEGLDYEALEAEEMDEEQLSIAIAEDIYLSTPSGSSTDTCETKSTKSNPGS